MINESGTMTGGGGKPRGGRMCIGSQAPRGVDSRAAAQELAAAEQELLASQEALRDARGRLSDAGADAKNAERMLSDLETAIPKVRGGWRVIVLLDARLTCVFCVLAAHPVPLTALPPCLALWAVLQTRMEAEAAQATATDLQQRLGELEAATRVSCEDAARLKALGAEMAQEERALAELRRKSEGLSRRAEELQQQIVGAGGEKLRRQRALCNKLQEVGCTCCSCWHGIEGDSSNQVGMAGRVGCNLCG